MNLSSYTNKINFPPSTNLPRQATILFKSYVTMAETMEEASRSILSKGKGLVNRGKSLYQELIKKILGVKVIEYKNPSFVATETEMGIINKMAEKYNLPAKTKEKLIGLLVEDGKVMGNKTLLDRFTPKVVSYPQSEAHKQEVISSAFNTSLYNVLDIKSGGGPDWTRSPILESLRNEAINLTRAKGTITGDELIKALKANNGLSF